MNYYIINFDPAFDFDFNLIQQAIVQNKNIKDWWHYLPNVYIIGTDQNSKYIADYLIAQFKDLKFIVIKVDLNDYNGVLNHKAWDWFKDKTKVLFRLKTVQKAKPFDPYSIAKWGSRPIIKIKKSTQSTPQQTKLLSDFLKIKPK
jgi:hypothetical protein